METLLPGWLLTEQPEFIRFEAPSGFKFDFNDATHITNTIVALVEPKESFSTRNQDVLDISLGNIEVLKADRWINKDFDTTVCVADRLKLAIVLIRYLGALCNENPGKLL